MQNSEIYRLCPRRQEYRCFPDCLLEKHGRFMMKAKRRMNTKRKKEDQKDKLANQNQFNDFNIEIEIIRPIESL